VAELLHTVYRKSSSAGPNTYCVITVSSLQLGSEANMMVPSSERRGQGGEGVLLRRRKLKRKKYVVAM